MEGWCFAIHFVDLVTLSDHGPFQVKMADLDLVSKVPMRRVLSLRCTYHIIAAWALMQRSSLPGVYSSRGSKSRFQGYLIGPGLVVFVFPVV
jgi:hypothetical protein